jgi:hypothetical protein
VPGIGKFIKTRRIEVMEWEWKDRKLLFDEYTVSSWDDENILHNGDSYTK